MVHPSVRGYLCVLCVVYVQLFASLGACIACNTDTRDFRIMKHDVFQLYIFVWKKMSRIVIFCHNAQKSHET